MAATMQLHNSEYELRCICSNCPHRDCPFVGQKWQEDYNGECKDAFCKSESFNSKAKAENEKTVKDFMYIDSASKLEGCNHPPNYMATCSKASSTRTESHESLYSTHRFPSHQTMVSSFFRDAISAIIFFLFWMVQFWLSIGCSINEFWKYLYRSQRPIRIVTGILFLLIFSTVFIHILLLVHENANNKSSIVTGEYTKKYDEENKQSSVPGFFKVILKNPKQIINTNRNKIFTLTIVDEKGTLIYKAEQKFAPPDNVEKPIVILSVDPITFDKF